MTLSGAQLEQFEAYWQNDRVHQTARWKKIEPRWCSGQAIVVKTFSDEGGGDGLPYERVKANVGHDLWALGIMAVSLL